MNNEDRVINLLEEIERDTDELIDMLKRSDYFIAPASTRFHLNYKGGLVEHVLNVFRIYKYLYEKYGLNNEDSEYYIPYESVVLESLLHDLCKLGKYKKVLKNECTENTMNFLLKLIKQNPVKVVEKNISITEDSVLTQEYASKLIDFLKNKGPLPNENNFEKDWGWDYREDDYLPLGHGEKSVILAQRYIDLKKREVLAIRWHMSSWEEGVYRGDKSRSHNKAKDMFPDVQLLQIADYNASFEEHYGLKY